MSANDSELLSILEAHGQDFLQSFDIPSSYHSKKRQAANAKAGPSSLKRPRLFQDGSSSEEEWRGIQPKAGGFLEEDSELDADSDVDNSGAPIRLIAPPQSLTMS